MTINVLQHPEKPFNISDQLIPILGFCIVTALLIYGLKSGIKTVRKEKLRVHIDYTKPLLINLNGKIEYKDYRNLLLRNSIKRPHIFIFSCFFTLLLFSTLNNSGNYFSSNYLMLIVLLSIFLFSPVLVIIQAKKFYNSNRIFQESLDYQITNETLHVKGTTVDSIQKWNHFYKLKDTKNFLMFFHGENVATLLQKEMFKPEELKEFYEFINSLDLKMEK